MFISPYTTRSVQNYLCGLSKLPTQSFSYSNCPAVSYTSTSGTMNSATFDPRAIAQLPQNIAELNPGESETRSCGADSSLCFNYFTYLDTSSQGNLGNGTGTGKNGEFLGLVDLRIGSWYVTAANQHLCEWANDWNLTTGSSMGSYAWTNAIDWSGSPYNGSVKRNIRMPNSAYRVAVSRTSNVTQDRCPSWNLSDGSTQTGAHKGVLVPYDAAWNLLPKGTDTFAGIPTGPNCTGVPNETCKMFLCGQPIVGKAPGSSLMDWWVCSGPLCNTAGAGATWTEACLDSNTCTITMADKDTYLISIPSDLRAQVEADPDGDCSWMLATGGL